MLDIALVEPEIPHNTGAIARTCAATGARLHLIKPLGFDISDKMVKRCGLDYWYVVDISVYENLDEFFEKNGDGNIYLATTKAPRAYTEADMSGDVRKGNGGAAGMAARKVPRQMHTHPYDQ